MYESEERKKMKEATTKTRKRNTRSDFSEDKINFPLVKSRKYFSHNM